MWRIATSVDVGVHLAVEVASVVVEVDVEVASGESFHQVRHASLLRIVRDRVVPEVWHGVAVDPDHAR